MKLIKVSARNLKGLTFSLDLLAINFLVGSNFAGKTARLDAVRLLLIGYLPELGKLARSTFSLCSGKELLVEGEFDDGSKASRRWYLKGDSVKTDEALPGWFDTVDVEMVTMLHADTYFALSERERINYVFANIPGMEDARTPDLLSVELAGKLREVDEIKDATRQDFDPVERFTDSLWEAKTTAEREHSFDGWTPQSFVEFSLEHAATQGKVSREVAIKMEKTAQGLSALRASDAPQVDLPSIDAKRAALSRDLQELYAKKGNKIGAHETQGNNRRRREQIKRELLPKDRLVAQRDELKASLEKARTALADVPEVNHADIEAFRTEEREATAAVADIDGQLRVVKDGIARNETELRSMGGLTACPYCGASGEGWKALKDAEITTALHGLRAKLDQLSEHRARVKDHADRCGTRVRDAIQRQQARNDAEARIRSMELNLTGPERQVAAFAGLESELERIPKDDPELSAAVEILVTEINVKQDEMADLDRQAKAATGRAHDLKRLAEAETARDDAKVDELTAKEAAKLLREVQAKMVEAAFGPLLASANAFFGEVLKSPLAYHDGEIGTWRSGAWVSHRTFSGTEKALAYAAIQAALAARSPVRLMVIDELGRLDNVNAAKVAACIAFAVKEGRIEQFIGVDVFSRHGEIIGSCVESDCQSVDIA